MAVVIAWQWWGGGMETAGWRVVARDVGDGVDRVTRNLFGFGRKSRQEKFPGGGGGAEAAVVSSPVWIQTPFASTVSSRTSFPPIFASRIHSSSKLCGV
ncbi:hypothetical protein Tco_0163042 [Tanacetum coccineum]